jgi:hypothetical protein
MGARLLRLCKVGRVGSDVAMRRGDNGDGGGRDLGHPRGCLAKGARAGD